MLFRSRRYDAGVGVELEKARRCAHAGRIAVGETRDANDSITVVFRTLWPTYYKKISSPPPLSKTEISTLTKQSHNQ